MSFPKSRHQSLAVGARLFRRSKHSRRGRAIKRRDFLGSIVFFCLSPDSIGRGALTSFIVTPHALALASVSRQVDGKEGLCRDLQFFLGCRQVQCNLSQDSLHRQKQVYVRSQCMIRGVVLEYSWTTNGTDIEDLAQEVWAEVVTKLPILEYNPERGSLSSWLACLAKRKIRQLRRRQVVRRVMFTIDTEKFDRLPSRELGPEERCVVREQEDRLKSALAKFSREISPANFEIFCRHYFLNQSYTKIGAELKMNADNVRFRCFRLKKKWDEIGKTCCLDICGDQAGLRSIPPPEIVLSCSE